MLTNIRAHVRAYNALNIINKFHFGFCAENACEIIAIANSSGVRCLCERSKSVCLHAHMCVRVCVCVRVSIARRSNGLHGIGTDAKTRLMSHTYTHICVCVYYLCNIYSHVCVRTCFPIIND